MTENRQFLNGYSEVNGIKMYYKESIRRRRTADAGSWRLPL
jgi:hypothetical protein